MADLKEQIVSKLIDSIPALLIILGAGFLLLVISQGVKGWVTVTDPISRVLGGVIGFGLVVMGLYGVKPQAALPRPTDFQIKIVHPKPGDRVTVTDVRGSIERSLPEGYTLKIFRYYPGERFYPLRDCRIEPGGTSWEASACDIGGKTNDTRWLAVMMVGPSGAALLKFHREASEVHNRVRDELQKVTKSDPPFLPAVETPTRDMIECARVELKRA
jgi:hypothetical protein